MEILEYVPGALAAGWMVVRIGMFFVTGANPDSEQQHA